MNYLIFSFLAAARMSFSTMYASLLSSDLAIFSSAFIASSDSLKFFNFFAIPYCISVKHYVTL